MAKHSSHILELAKLGAAHRYRELKAELSLLVQQFPHVRGGQARRLGSPAEAVKYPIQRKRHMSAAARKVVSQRMKKYWAAKRKPKEV